MNNDNSVINILPKLESRSSAVQSTSYKLPFESNELKPYDSSDSYDVVNSLACGIEMEDNEMNNSDDILLKYIDSLDKKYDSLKNDMIEAEKRITQNNKELEDRLEKKYVETNNNINQMMNKIDRKFDNLDNKVDSKLEKMSMEIKENNKYLRNISITTICSIAGMVITIVIALITVVLTIKSMIPS